MMGRMPKPHRIVPVASMTVMPSRTPSRNDVSGLGSLRGGVGVPTTVGGLGAPGGGGEAAPGGVALPGVALLVVGTRGLVGRSSGWATCFSSVSPEHERVSGKLRASIPRFVFATREARPHRAGLEYHCASEVPDRDASNAPRSASTSFGSATAGAHLLLID